jgi:mRNA-degrading endonuclease RelE of RelBE toxin-antitoxin system
MRLHFTRRAARDYESLPTALRKKTDKQLDLLRQNLRHPSLRAKKYDEASGVWQGRIDRSYRFYFQIIGDAYLILSIIPHPK